MLLRADREALDRNPCDTASITEGLEDTCPTS
jgi:hypothetical protein